MNIFFIFLFIFIVITAIIGVYIFANKKQVDKIMKREDNTYTGISNNSFDIYRIYRVLKKKNNNLSYKESKLLKEQLSLAIIWYVLLIAYFIFMFFFDW